MKLLAGREALNKSILETERHLGRPVVLRATSQPEDVAHPETPFVTRINLRGQELRYGPAVLAVRGLTYGLVDGVVFSALRSSLITTPEPLRGSVHTRPLNSRLVGQSGFDVSLTSPNPIVFSKLRGVVQILDSKDFAPDDPMLVSTPDGEEFPEAHAFIATEAVQVHGMVSVGPKDIFSYVWPVPDSLGFYAPR